MLLGDWPFNEDEASQAVSLSARLFGKALAFCSAMRPLRTASPVALTASVKGVASFGVNWTLEVRMIEMPPGAAVEQRNQGYYVAGTRISLDGVAWALKRGDPPTKYSRIFRPSDPGRDWKPLSRLSTPIHGKSRRIWLKASGRGKRPGS